MYESPVTVYVAETQSQIEDGVLKLVTSHGFDVSKEELAKALMYDRKQYSKGYSDGYAEAIREFVNMAWDDLGDNVMDLHCRTIIVEFAERMKGGELNGNS